MVPVSTAFAAWLPLLLALSATVTCMVIYTGEAKARPVIRRLFVGVCLAAALSVGIRAAEVIYVPDLCPGLAPYSAEWWFHGCFLP
jgi:hypothetical protein